MSYFRKLVYKVNKMESKLDLKTSRKKNNKFSKKKYKQDPVEYLNENDLTQHNISYEELEKVKYKIRTKLSIERKIRWVLTISVVCLICIALFIFLR